MSDVLLNVLAGASAIGHTTQTTAMSRMMSRGIR
jgi:hypothetical protein